MFRRNPIALLALTGALASTPPAMAAAEKPGYTLPPPTTQDVAITATQIGPLDKLDITVFQVKDLTGPVEVDSSGKVTLPLVGTLQASGRSTTDLAKDIADRLRAGYIKDPQVTVTEKEAISQKATVGGAVTKPGVYPIPGHTTLSSVVALAGGADPDRANQKHVRLIRMVNGQRMQATYNLVDIQKGSVPDPEVFGNDTVIVETSSGRTFLRDLATASPLFYLFRFW